MNGQESGVGDFMEFPFILEESNELQTSAGSQWNCRRDWNQLYRVELWRKFPPTALTHLKCLGEIMIKPL